MVQVYILQIIQKYENTVQLARPVYLIYITSDIHHNFFENNDFPYMQMFQIEESSLLAGVSTVKNDREIID